MGKELLTVQTLNERTRLHYRHPRVPGLQGKCRLLKKSLFKCAPMLKQCPWGLVRPVAPRPFWNQKLLLIGFSRDSEGQSNLRTAILILMIETLL